MKRVLVTAFTLLIGLQLSRAANVNVEVFNNFFQPKDVSIKVGDTVTWIRRSSGHDVVSPGNFDSGFPMPATFTHTFNSAGNFSYFCTPHIGVGMTGVVRVASAPVNQLPTVAITSPANGATFTTAQQVTITATAADTDGTIASVQFFDGQTSLGIDTGAPYSVTVTLAQGSHTLTARATDNAGGSTTSAAITINVTPPPNQLPTVAITSPANGANFTTGQSVTITATAADSDGTVAQVQFLDSGNLLGSDSAAPYEFTFTPGEGSHALTARAIDNSGGSADSAVIIITVSGPANQPPTVSFTSPAASAVFAEGAPVTFKANAADPEGQLSRVEFSVGGTLVSTDASAPYEFTATNLAVGQQTVTAVAFDAQGAQSTAASVSVIVIRRSKIESLTRVSPTEIRISATGASGFPHTLQFSSDLQSWTDIATANPNRGALTYTDNPPAGTEFRFYRIVVK